MKRIIGLLLFITSAFTAFSQPGSLSGSAIRSKVQDTTTLSFPTGYGVLYWNNATLKWMMCDAGGTNCREIGTGDGGSSGSNYRYPIELHTSSFTLAKADTAHTLVLNSGSTITINLDDFSSGPDGMTFSFYHKGAGDVNINANGETITGSAGNTDSPGQGNFMYMVYDSASNAFYLGNGTAATIPDLDQVLTQGSTANIANPFAVTSTSGGFNIQSNESGVSSSVIGTSVETSIEWDDGVNYGNLTMDVNGNRFTGSETFSFAPTATESGLNVGSVAGDPSSPENGDLWYDQTANELTARINGVNVALGEEQRYSFPPVIFTANHTIGFSDTTKVIVMDATGGDLELHIPQDATTDFSHGQLLTVKLIGGNDLTIIDDGSAVVTSTSGSLVVAGSADPQFISLFKDNTNTWTAIVPGSGGGTTYTFSAPLSESAGTVSIPASNGSTDGYLDNADWTTFNNKQAAITFGTGVQTALGINIGSDGAPVLFNGALGTPASATLTNATGLPVTSLSGSWSNLTSTLTGTAPYWATTGTSTLTGTTAIAGGTNPLTFTNNIQDGFRQTATFTTTANNQQLALIDHTITTRNSASDVASSVGIKPVFTAGAASQILYGLNIDISGSNFATNSPTIYALNAVGGGVFTQTSSALSPLALLVNRTSGNGSIMEVQSNSTAIFRISNGANSTAVSILPTGTLTTALNLGGTVTTSSGTGNLATLSGTLTAGANNDVLRGIRGIPVFGANTRTNVVAVGYYHNPSFTISSGSWAFQGGIVIDNTTSGVNLLNGFNLAPGSVLSTVDIDGSVGVDITSTSTDITANATHHTILVDASGAARTITLPTAASSNRRVYVIKKTDSSGNTVTIDGDGSETIDGATTNVISAQWSTRVIQSNGTAWFVTASF